MAKKTAMVQPTVEVPSIGQMLQMLGFDRAYYFISQKDQNDGSWVYTVHLEGDTEDVQIRYDYLTGKPEIV